MSMFENEELFPERAKNYGKGPADCKWPSSEPVTALTINRPTNHDGEAVQVTVPVYKEDTFEDIQTRFHVLAQMGDKRMEENNAALQKAMELEREAKQKKDLELEAQRSTLKAMKKAGKAGNVAAVAAIAGGKVDAVTDHPGSAVASQSN